jgi:ribosome-associated protein
MQPPLHELEITYVRSSGPGGQNVNKVNSKCVIRWDVLGSPSISPSVRERFAERFASKLTVAGELVVTSDRHRDQKRNYEDCIQKISEMLSLVARPPKLRKKTKPTKGSQRRRLEGKKVQSDKKAARRRAF